MKLLLASLAVVGGAIALSKRSRGGALGAVQPTMGDSTVEALDAVYRAAEALYPAIDKPRAGRSDILWNDQDYLPTCDLFASEAEEALHAASRAVSNGEPQAYSAKIAAIQAWALSQAECDRDSAWGYDLVEQPLVPV